MALGTSKHQRPCRRASHTQIIPVTTLFPCTWATGGFTCVYVGHRCGWVGCVLPMTPSLVCMPIRHVREVQDTDPTPV